MYERWRISRWVSPVADIERLLMVSLTDADRVLTVVLEGPQALGRPRWRVTFRGYPAYRNIDEAYRVSLWKWLDDSGQRCGGTFTVTEDPHFASWETGYLQDVEPKTRHFVIATEDDVIEVLSAQDPTWEILEPAHPGDLTAGKAEHLYIGEDDEAIRKFIEQTKGRS